MRLRGGTPGSAHGDAREFAAGRSVGLYDEPTDQVVLIVGEQALAVRHGTKAQLTNDGHGQAGKGPYDPKGAGMLHMTAFHRWRASGTQG